VIAFPLGYKPATVCSNSVGDQHHGAIGALRNSYLLSAFSQIAFFHRVCVPQHCPIVVSLSNLSTLWRIFSYRHARRLVVGRYHSAGSYLRHSRNITRGVDCLSRHLGLGVAAARDNFSSGFRMRGRGFLGRCRPGTDARRPRLPFNFRCCAYLLSGLDSSLFDPRWKGLQGFVGGILLLFVRQDFTEHCSVRLIVPTTLTVHSYLASPGDLPLLNSPSTLGRGFTASVAEDAGATGSPAHFPLRADFP